MTLGLQFWTTDAGRGAICSLLAHAVAAGSLAYLSQNPRVDRPREMSADPTRAVVLQVTLDPWQPSPQTASPRTVQVHVAPRAARVGRQTFVVDAGAAVEMGLLESSVEPFESDALRSRWDADSRSVNPQRPPDLGLRAVVQPPWNTNAVQITPAATTTLPSFLDNPPPVYPPLAIRRGWQGTVWLRVVIDAEGQVSDVQVTESSGHPLLDGAAVNAVRQWRAEPARRGGRPVPIAVRLPVRFGGLEEK